MKPMQIDDIPDAMKHKEADMSKAMAAFLASQADCIIGKRFNIDSDYAGANGAKPYVIVDKVHGAYVRGKLYEERANGHHVYIGVFLFHGSLINVNKGMEP